MVLTGGRRGRARARARGEADALAGAALGGDGSYQEIPEKEGQEHSPEAATAHPTPSINRAVPPTSTCGYL